MMQTFYRDQPPTSIPCWYCGQSCPKFHQDQALYSKLVESKGIDYSQRWEYHCRNHGELEIEVTCVKHDVDPPNWFFNRIAVIYRDLRLHWNFYSGHLVYLNKQDKSNRCWEAVSLGKWPPKFQTYPSEFLNQSPEKLISFFRLYRVWS